MSSLALVLRLGERVWLVVFFCNNLLRAACRITKGLAVLQVIYLGRCRRCNEYGTIMRMDEAVAKSQKTKKLGRSSKSDLSCVFCVSLLSAREGLALTSRNRKDRLWDKFFSQLSVVKRECACLQNEIHGKKGFK